MAIRLTHEQQTQKGELMAAMWVRHEELTIRIADANKSIATIRASIRDAGAAYGASLSDLHQFTALVRAQYLAEFAAQSAYWHSSPQGEAARLWLEQYQAFRPDALTLVLPSPVEPPSQDVLNEFEELSDSPAFS